MVREKKQIHVEERQFLKNISPEIKAKVIELYEKKHWTTRAISLYTGIFQSMIFKILGRNMIKDDERNSSFYNQGRM